MSLLIPNTASNKFNAYLTSHRRGNWVGFCFCFSASGLTRGSVWVGMQNWRLPSKLVVVVLTEDLQSLRVILYAFITLVKIMQFQIVTDSKIWSNIPRTLYTMFIWKARVIRWVSVGQCTHSRIWTSRKCVGEGKAILKPPANAAFGSQIAKSGIVFQTQQ